MTSSRPNPQPDKDMASPRPLFLEGAAGSIFALYYPSTQSSHSHVILPPFGEEMNRCRKFMNDLARAYQARGHSALILDFYGTGESEGGFSDARWEIWAKDCVTAAEFLHTQGHINLHVTALRLSALLALETSAHWKTLHLIAPELNGARFIHQLMRARLVAEQFITSQFGGNPSHKKDLERELQQNSSLNLLGYDLHKDLIQAIESAHVQSDNDKVISFPEISVPPLWMQFEPEDGQHAATALVEAELGS